MQGDIDPRAIGVWVILGVGGLLFAWPFLDGSGATAPIVFAILLWTISVLVSRISRLGEVFVLIGACLVVCGAFIVTTYTETTTLDFSTGDVTSSSDAGDDMGTGVALIVVGLLLAVAGYLSRRLSARRATDRSVVEILIARAPSMQAGAAVDLVGVLEAPIPAQSLHDIARRAVSDPDHPEITVFEDRPGLIRAGMGRAHLAPDFAVHLELEPVPAGSRVRIVVAHTCPAPVPGQGVVGGAELDALLWRVRTALENAAPGTRWIQVH